MTARRRASGKPKCSKGVALVFVLWLMAILSALALQMSFSSHLRVQVTADLSKGTRAFFLARAGVERAIADLIQSRDETQSLLDLRESDLHIYRNAELGDGTYTLFAGTDASGEPIYGIIDEAAKLNLNSADSQGLSKLPGITAALATEILASRGQDGFAHLNDLLTLENCDILTLYGEDQNHNALLDPNENDGDESWPPDNADDFLDRGIAAYLTIFSAARNISPEGEKRININSADAAALTKSVPGITQQEADSIVEHRKKNQFASIADLLDVELVEKVVQQIQTRSSDRQGGGGGGRGSSNGRGDSSQGGNRRNRGNRTRNLRTSDGNQQQKQQETQFKSTGKKAFDAAKLRTFAAYVTTKDEQVLKGLININTAPYEVLASLPGLDDTLALQIVRSREERLDAYQSVADLLDVPGFSTSAFKQACSRITVRSDVFSVRSFGVIGSGEIYRSVEAVIDRTQDVAAIRSWRELE